MSTCIPNHILYYKSINMLPWVLGAGTAKYSTQKGDCGNFWFKGKSEHRKLGLATCNWHLKWGRSCGTPLGIRGLFQVNSVRITLTSSGCSLELERWLVWGKRIHICCQMCSMISIKKNNWFSFSEMTMFVTLKIHVDTPASNMILFGDRAYKEVIQVKWDQKGRSFIK